MCPFGPSGGYPFFRGVSFTTSSLRPWALPRKLPKTVRFPKVPYKEFISAVAESIFQFLGLWSLIFFILALCTFISFRFGLLGLHFSLSASILAFGALRALRGGILWLFVSFWALRGVSFCSLRLFEPSGGILHNFEPPTVGPPHKLPKTVRFPKVPYKEFISAVAEWIFQFLGLWSLIFFILALCTFISFRFGLLGLHFSLSASILAFGAPRALRGGILWLFVSFWAFRGAPFCSLRLFGPSGGYPSQLWGPPTVGAAPPQVAKNGPFPQGPTQRIYQRRGRVDFPIFGLVGVNFLHFGFARLHFLSFWPSGPSF